MCHDIRSYTILYPLEEFYWENGIIPKVPNPAVRTKNVGPNLVQLTQFAFRSAVAYLPFAHVIPSISSAGTNFLMALKPRIFSEYRSHDSGWFASLFISYKCHRNVFVNFDSIHLFQSWGFEKNFILYKYCLKPTLEHRMSDDDVQWICCWGMSVIWWRLEDGHKRLEADKIKKSEWK